MSSFQERLQNAFNIPEIEQDAVKKDDTPKITRTQKQKRTITKHAGKNAISDKKIKLFCDQCGIKRKPDALVAHVRTRINTFLDFFLRYAIQQSDQKHLDRPAVETAQKLLGFS